MLLLFFLGCTLVPQKKHHPCSFPYIDYSAEALKIRQSWKPENFTLIQMHNPDDFIYIVHKIDKNYRLKKEIPEDSWTYKILKDPNVLTGSLFVSGSVITQDHLATAFAPESRVGFVLSSECHLVGPAFYKDMLSQRPKDLSDAPHAWKNLRRRFPEDLTPADITTQLKGTWYYNEVTMIGTDPSDEKRKIKIEALMIECPQNMKKLHLGTAALWSGKEDDIKQCLEGYAPREQVLPLVLELSRKYPILLKAALPGHDYDLFDKRNMLYPD